MRDWFEDHLSLIFCIVCIIIVIVAVVVGCVCGASGEFDIVKMSEKSPFREENDGE